NRQRHEEEQSAAPAAKAHLRTNRAKATSGDQGALALVDAPTGEPKTSKTKAAAPANKAKTRRTSR
ncbi:hypothetical protein, partial [Bradyrhizobium cosmicum]|uniref:hypothetical protein n=1 Tax=Bradyrhizobium cosmicum TaxID=1404864 RepID=UPI0028EF1296